MVEMNLDELLAEYTRLGLTAGDDEGLTTLEYAERWGISNESANKLLKRFSRVGWLHAGQKASRRIDGRTCRVPCYRIEVPNGQTKETKKTKAGKKT